LKIIYIYVYISSAGSGTVKFFNSQKILAIKNLKNCHLDFKYILKNSNNIYTLLLHNIEKNAQFYNIHKSALPFINKCIYLDTFNLCSQCTWGIFTFDQVVIDPKVKFMFRHLIKAKKKKIIFLIYLILSCINIYNFLKILI
jgi:hypothetical protein